MSSRLGGDRRKRICFRVDVDLAEWLREYAREQNVGQEVFIEASLRDYRKYAERRRANPRPLEPEDDD